MKFLAVIFDLFGTLVENFSFREHEDTLSHMAEILSAPRSDFIRLWLESFEKRITGFFPSPRANIEFICRELNIEPEPTSVESAARTRIEFTRHF